VTVPLGVNWIEPGRSQSCPGSVVVVAVVLVVVETVVVVGGVTGAQTTFDALAVTTRLPNWSSNWNVGRTAFGHFTL
jgi:hypothetical protein